MLEVLLAGGSGIMGDYGMQAEQEVWDAVSANEERDTRSRLVHSVQLVSGHEVTVSRIVGTRTYVVAVDGCELGSRHDWTVDALNAGRARVAELACARRNERAS